MKPIIVRCANGVVVWEKLPAPNRTYTWQCTRDKFSIVAPADAAHVEQFLIALAQHSQLLAGAISQVVQLEL